jgi:NtrC-family two-component system sensor histidine kinase KinB
MVEVGWVPVTEALERLANGDTSVQAIEDSPIANVVNRLARKMRATEISTEATLATFPVPLLVFDAEGRVLMSTPAARKLFNSGASLPSARSQLSPSAQEAMGTCIDATLAGQDSAEGRALELELDGRRVRLMPLARAARDRHGRLVAVVVELRDGGRLQLAEALHYDLVATVAHELRTPLTSLHMSIHLCLEQAAGPLTDEQGILLSSAKEDCERLRLLAEELLDMGRLAAGRVTLDLLALAPQEIAQRAFSSFRSLAGEKRICLDFQVAETLPHVMADRERIHRVFSNLLSNALRHTPAAGCITISAARMADRVRFEVSDTGEGIAQAHLAQVFEKFVRGPGKVHSGFGLGLCIARDIVTAHGGGIGVESQPGKGSTFWFTLPCRCADAIAGGATVST